MNSSIYLKSTSTNCRSHSLIRLFSLFSQAILFGIFFLVAYHANAQVVLNPSATVNLTMTQGQAFSQNFIGTGTQDNSYMLVGVLPVGLELSTVSSPPPATSNHEMLLSGVPTTAGVYSFNVDVNASFFSVPVTYSTTIVVTVLPLPPIADPYNLLVLQNSIANVFTPNISGSVTSISLVTSPTHGSATISGLTISYTPTGSYVGNDTFSYQAMGPGGVSTPANVSITVTPLPPSIAPGSFVVNANSGANIVTPTILGNASSINVITSPTHGVASISGLSLLYTPAAGYFGNDSIAINAVGPGGTSAVAMMNITINPPPPSLVASTVTVNTNSIANIISPSISGIASNITIINPPIHGTVNVDGMVLLYTPTAGFFGNDNLTVVVSGPGGNSSPGVISILVTPPPPQVVAESIIVQVGSTNNSIMPSINGIVTSLNLVSSPAHGSVVSSGFGFLYTPVAGYLGADSFVISAVGPGGVSAPSIISVLVVERPPVITGRSFTVLVNSNGNNISPVISGTVDSINLTGSALHGDVSIVGTSVFYTPAANFIGTDSLTLSASGPGGASNSVTISIEVVNNATIVTDMNVAVPINSLANIINPQASAMATGISVTSQPMHGTVEVSGMSLRYTPSIGYVGKDFVEISINGSAGVVSRANITISVIASPPSIIDANFVVSADSTGNVLSPRFSGIVSSIIIVQGTLNGSTTIDGLSIRYTPKRSFVGNDVLKVKAIGPSGVSEISSISINVLSSSPKIDPVAISIIPGSREIRIVPTITGDVQALQINSGPSNGVVSVVGLELRYTPNTGFIGLDQFFISAVGDSGVSSPALITINVQTEQPQISDLVVQVSANSNSNRISPKIVGEVSALQIESTPAHGTVVVNGLDLIYTPTPGFVGSDSIVVSAIGVSGVTSRAKISISVQALSVNGSNITVQANSANNVLPVPSLAGAVGLNLITPATQGVAVVQGLGLNYTPKPNFVGSDSVTYAVVGVNGSFASATIQILVVAAAPVFKDASLTVETGRSASIDLASLISGPMFNGVSIRLNSSPTHGVASISGTVLTYSSTAGYVGLDSLQLTATAIGGTSNPAQLLITVVPRPDPSKDPGVIAMFAANTAAVRHFEQTQIEHFNGRMLSLASQSANGKSTAGQNTVTECGPISYWVSGLNSAGRYRTMNGLKYSTFGLSAGGDRCFAGGQTHIGFGLGYARDHSESERDLSFMKASANTAASYLTTQLFPSMRFSFMIGVNQIQDRFARFDVHDQALAYGEWKGTQMISSGALSSDVSFGKVLLIPYLRLDLTKLQLDPFSESGGGAYLLHYHKQTMQSQRSTLGFNSEIKLATSWGELIPRLKLELQRDFARRDSLKINYVDMPDAVYLVPNNDLDRRVVLVSLGADMIWKNGIMAIFNFSHTNANAKNKSNRFNVRFSYQY